MKPLYKITLAFIALTFAVITLIQILQPKNLGAQISRKFGKILSPVNPGLKSGEPHYSSITLSESEFARVFEDISRNSFEAEQMKLLIIFDIYFTSQSSPDNRAYLSMADDGKIIFDSIVYEYRGSLPIFNELWWIKLPR